MAVNKKKIPTFLALTILSISLAFGVILVQSKNIFRLGADVTIAPKNVRISNITDSSFTVSWTSTKNIAGFIAWGKSQSSLKNIEGDEIGESGYLHSVSIQGLTSSSTYYFKINSGGGDFDNNGVPWKVDLPQKISSQTSIKPISGVVLTATGDPAPKILVYLDIGGVSPISTVTSDNGSWIIPLSDLRSSDLNSPYSLDEKTDIIDISIQAGPLGTSSAQIYAPSARPAPPIILGQTHDFKNLSPTSADELPKAELNAPEKVEKTSKFNVSNENPESNPKNVTITSIKDGEVINTEKPEFFGEGPPGTKIIVTVESTPVTEKVTIKNSGNWKWSPPTNLEPGIHKITISYKDENGILQTLIRTFIIQASEAPAFEATPSASPEISPTPETTEAPIGTLIPTSSPTSSPTPTATIALKPDSGISTPTFAIVILGMALILGGIGLGIIINEN